MTRNEKTSARVAKIAGRVLATGPSLMYPQINVWLPDGTRARFKWSDIRALAASCLTQAPTKKRKPIRSPAKRASKRKRK